MDWKAYYADELRMEGARERICTWLKQADRDDDIDRLLRQRAILSFPHTAIAFSGPLQARVVAGLLRANVRRVIVLGVLHGIGVEAIQTARDASALPEDRRRAFREVCGGFFPCADAWETPFGAVQRTLPDGCKTEILREDVKGYLIDEFSLDTFFAILQLAAEWMRIEPPEVVPLYVGVVRHPLTGEFEVAHQMGHWLRQAWTDDTAIVATGDVVHYGTAYGSTLLEAELPELVRRFRRQLAETLDMALAARDWSAAYIASRDRLKSDQRELLPVLSALLGEGASAEILSFTLSNYAPIVDTPPPCLVASALIAYIHRSTCIEPGEESEAA